MHSQEKLLEFSERFERLYSPAVADALDRLGMWDQILDSALVPLKLDQKIAGPAYTAKGYATTDVNTGLGASALNGLTPGCVAVWDTSGDTVTGHWGELMSNMALARQCRGAIVDGGIRDTGMILEVGFPVWSRFRSPADALGRWTIQDAGIPVLISGVLIRPGDFIVADADGVVVVPIEVVEEVLKIAETVVDKENDIRAAVTSGQPLHEMYQKFKLTESTILGRDGQSVALTQST